MNIPKYWYLLAFFSLCIFQWYMLSSWIYTAESIKTKGTFMKIPCMQVDPIDPLRGTYLSINPHPTQFEFEDSLTYLPGDEIWVNYECVESNTCTFLSVQPIKETPSEKKTIRCKVQNVYRPYKDSTHVQDKFIAIISYPFTRYYIHQGVAPDLAEKYNMALRDTRVKVYAGIYVHEGKVALEGVWLGDKKLQ